jgi:hypothetical protein
MSEDSLSGLHSTLMKIPQAIIGASITIIIIVVWFSGVTNTNGLSALIGGCYGLLVGLLAILLVNSPSSNLLHFLTSILTFLLVMAIIIVMIVFLSMYFDIIVSGEAAPSYYYYSKLYFIILGIQLWQLLQAIYSSDKASGGSLKIGMKQQASLNFFAVLNVICLIIVGSILHYYSTQG